MTTVPTLPGTVSKSSATSANNVGLSVPGGLIDGDALMFIGTHQNQPPSDWTLPSAFGRIGNAFVANDADYRGDIISARPVPTAPVTGPLTFTFPGTGRIAGILAIVRGANLSNLDGGHPAAKAAISGTVRTMPSFTVAEDNSLFVMMANNQVTSPNADTATVDDGSLALLAEIASPGDTTVTRTSLKVWTRTMNAGPSGTKSVTWAGAATGASIMAVAIRPAAVTPPTIVAFTRWDGSAEQPVNVKIYDGAAEDAITAFAVQPRNLTVPQIMALGRPFNWAHRFGSANWVEFSARAAKEAASFWAADALEVSLQWSASGTPWCSHDAYLDRMVLGTPGGTTLPIASLTDTQIRSYTQTAAYTDVPSQPREPLMTLDELDALYPGMALVIEDKTYTHAAALRTWIDAHGVADRVIWKQDGTGTRFPQASGLVAWGYFFDAGMAPSFATKQAQWDLVGLDYNSSDATLTAAIATATPARSTMHIIPSAAQRTRALGLGVRGLMIANVRDAVPKPS